MCSTKAPIDVIISDQPDRKQTLVIELHFVVDYIIRRSWKIFRITFGNSNRLCVSAIVPIKFVVKFSALFLAAEQMILRDFAPRLPL